MCEAKYDFLTVRDIQRTLKIGKNYRIPAEGFYAWLESAGVAKQ